MLRMLVFSVSCSLVALASSLPSWTAPALDYSKKFGGVSAINNTVSRLLFRATPELGTYNHAAMIDYHFGQFLASWKNSPVDEDSPGQRCLFSQSLDGENWTQTDGKNILFPNMSTEALHVALFCEPAVHINGRVYTAASPKQFCLWPVQWSNLTLLREVRPGLGNFGPIFWMTNEVPTGYEYATNKNGVLTLNKMDAQTIADIETLATRLPCDFNGTTKCEACSDGCQPWNEAQSVDGIGNERSHYVVPSTNGDTADQQDVLLYRSHIKSDVINHLYASVRESVSANWSIPVATNITDDVANFNAGRLPDGRVYLLSNAFVDPKVAIRDPLYITSSHDGWHFDQTVVLTSCTYDVYQHPPNQTSGCVMRLPGKSKQNGVQYPQGLPVTDSRFRGFWAIFSLNKEDVWITFAPFSF